MSEQPRRRGRVAEGERNRQRLVEVAAELFGAGEPVALEEIAARAGVGIGTLYRHFPGRESLVLAVYGHQVAQLGVTADRLLADRSPREALRGWAAAFLDWARAKQGMGPTLQALMDEGRLGSAQMRADLIAVVDRFLAAGREHGDLRADAEAADVAALLAGVPATTRTPGQAEQAARMVDLVVDGLRP